MSNNCRVVFCRYLPFEVECIEIQFRTGRFPVFTAQLAQDPGQEPLTERGRDQGGITGRICASCLMGAKKFPREG